MSRSVGAVIHRGSKQIKEHLQGLVWKCPVSSGRPTAMTRDSFLRVCMMAQGGQVPIGGGAFVKLRKKIDNTCCSFCPAAEKVRLYWELLDQEDGEAYELPVEVARVVAQGVVVPDPIRIIGRQELMEMGRSAGADKRVYDAGLVEARRYALLTSIRQYEGGKGI